MATPTRLEDVDISTLVDIGLPTDLLNAITTAQLDLASISIERESMEADRAAERAQAVINLETERATTNRRIRGLEEALGALASERPDIAPSSADELPAACSTYEDLVGTTFRQIVLISTRPTPSPCKLLQKTSNLPVALAKTPCNPGGRPTLARSPIKSTPATPCSSCQHPSLVSLSVLEETNQNITAAQKDLLLWHFVSVTSVFRIFSI